MEMRKILSIYRKALFPAIMTIISFILFIVVYLLLTVKSIEPFYFEGLIFAVPFVCFGITTFFTVRGKFKIVASSVITCSLIFVLGFTSLFAFIIVGIKGATTTT